MKSFAARTWAHRTLAVWLALSLIGVQFGGLAHRVEHPIPLGLAHALAPHAVDGADHRHDPGRHDCGAYDAAALGHGPPVALVVRAAAVAGCEFAPPTATLAHKASAPAFRPRAPPST